MEKQIALVLDDEPFVCKTLSRMLCNHFDEIVLATCEAEAIKGLETHRVTHLICDSNLGPDSPLGPDLIARWRTEYPSIERAVVFSGTVSQVPDEVDAVVAKPGSMNELLVALQVGVPATSSE